MPKSRNRKIKKKNNKKSNPKPYEVVKSEYVQMRNPLPEDIPFDLRIEVLTKMGNDATVTFESEYKKLLTYFEEYDPLYLCSFCSYYFTMQPEGLDEEAINGCIDFPPFFLEILQCLSLKQQRCLSLKPLNHDIDNFKSTVSNFCRSQSSTNLSLVKGAKNEDEIGAILLRAEMMGRTIAIRNWAYVSQMENVAYELAGLIEGKFFETLAFRAKDFLDILFALAGLTEKKVNDHRAKTVLIVKAKGYNEIIDKYEECFPTVEKINKAEREEFWIKCGKSAKRLKCLLLAHSDCFLYKAFTHNVSEIFDYLSGKIAHNEISKILDKVSYKFGDLADINKDFIFLDNPIHSKPFIKIENHKYFSAIGHMFSHLGMDLVERFISTDNKLKTEYISKKREVS
ncbi:MAG: hypothetical protein LUG51_01565 [Tannerellaceae bacterium]|nr:hypothetical protein [Tannerellaceae bacterium]